jgi:hypothetical protein
MGDEVARMPNPEYLRKEAERLLAAAIITEDRKLIEMLAAKANEYLDEARALEATKQPQPWDTEARIGPLSWRSRP